MKPSIPYWLRVIAWGILAVALLFLIFYGITGNLGRAALVTFALILFANVSKRVYILSKIATFMDVGFLMQDTHDEEKVKK